ncbi:hypothetical protein [Streptomyces radicis]|uniref:DUF3558 domain-containing protein n=1 Tax=Streptomyces radicis TaxID=1750517 RepID=A0A3A9W851_9ACTN|nr:hypothetical protein [Streptomyces radicis]RKN09325.1 hypothetical protein D7319_12750 [Streptomyces radicis]RKN23077.1 hypothetical protein D7318_13775 [Streptomyces radicis]
MRRIPAAFLLTTILACSACTSGSDEPDEEAREFVIPEDLCNLTVDPDLVSPLLPPGEELRADPELIEYPDGSLGTTARCVVHVDDSPALTLDAIPSWPSGVAAGVGPYLDHRRVGHSVAEGEVLSESPREVVVWDDYAAIHVTCAASPALDNTGMNLAITLDWAEGEDHRDALAEAIGPLMDEFLARQAPGTCETA